MWVSKGKSLKKSDNVGMKSDNKIGEEASIPDEGENEQMWLTIFLVHNLLMILSLT